jgi:hypothetical protein
MYWSTACGDLKPTCIAAPSSAAEMAQVIKNLHDVGRMIFGVIVNLVQVLSRNQQAVLDTSKSIVGVMSSLHDVETLLFVLFLHQHQ